MDKRKKCSVVMELKSGHIVFFSGSRDALRGLIDLIGMGLRITKIKIKVSKKGE